MKLHFILGLALVTLSAADAAADSVTRARFLMGTVCEITAHGPDAAKAASAAFDEIDRLEKALSLLREDSELSTLNRRAAVDPFPCSNDLFEVLHAAREVHRFSGGAFDPTAARGRRALGFDKVRLDGDAKTAEFAVPGVRVDLNAIAKGYALDAAARVLAKRGVSSALLNFGGQVLALGAPPGQDAWEVRLAGTPLALRVKDASVATSSQEERPGHVLDPRTGKPVARKGTVTVVAKDGARADAWSTALFVLGAAKAPRDFDGCAIESAGGRAGAQTPSCKAFLAPAKGANPRQEKETQ